MASRPTVGWWAEKVGRFVSYLRANVGPDERAEVATMLTPPQLALFEAMPVADQRHGLDVAAALRRGGFGEDRELLVAALLHDVGKGRTVRLWQRIAWSLGQRYGGWVILVAGLAPGAGAVFARLERHATVSAELVRAAGGSERLAGLIAQQSAPVDPAARVLHLADEGELHPGAGAQPGDRS